MTDHPVTPRALLGLLIFLILFIPALLACCLWLLTVTPVGYIWVLFFSRPSLFRTMPDWVCPTYPGDCLGAFCRGTIGGIHD